MADSFGAGSWRFFCAGLTRFASASRLHPLGCDSGLHCHACFSLIVGAALALGIVLHLVQILSCSIACRRDGLLIDNSFSVVMSYEPGTTECRVLINSKESIETMLLNLSRLEGAESILLQLRQVHQQLELLHDQRRMQVDAQEASAVSLS